MAPRHSSALVVLVVSVLVLAPAAVAVPAVAAQPSSAGDASTAGTPTDGTDAAFDVGSDSATTGPLNSALGLRAQEDDDEDENDEEDDADGDDDENGEDDEGEDRGEDDERGQDDDERGEDDERGQDDEDREDDESDDGWWGDERGEDEREDDEQHDEDERDGESPQEGEEDEDDDDWFWWFGDDEDENGERGNDERSQDTDSPDRPGGEQNTDSTQNADNTTNTDGSQQDSGTQENSEQAQNDTERSSGSDDSTDDVSTDTTSTVPSLDVEPNISRATVTFVSVPEVVGQPLVVEATATNTGTEPGRKVVQFEVEHEIVENRSFVLAPGETRTVTFEYRFETPGNKTIEVDSGRNRFVTVEPRHPELAVTELRASEMQLSPGEAVRLTASVTNQGTATGDQAVALELFGEVVAVQNVSIPPGETRAVEFSRVIRAPGTYEATVGNASVSLTVSENETTTPGGDENRKTALGTPGFGPAVGVLAVALAVVAALWRRR